MKKKKGVREVIQEKYTKLQSHSCNKTSCRLCNVSVQTLANSLIFFCLPEIWAVLLLPPQILDNINQINVIESDYKEGGDMERGKFLKELEREE